MVGIEAAGIRHGGTFLRRSEGEVVVHGSPFGTNPVVWALAAGSMPARAPFAFQERPQIPAAADFPARTCPAAGASSARRSSGASSLSGKIRCWPRPVSLPAYGPSPPLSACRKFDLSAVVMLPSAEEGAALKERRPCGQIARRTAADAPSSYRFANSSRCHARKTEYLPRPQDLHCADDGLDRPPLPRLPPPAHAPHVALHRDGDHRRAAARRRRRATSTSTPTSTRSRCSSAAASRPTWRTARSSASSGATTRST